MMLVGILMLCNTSRADEKITNLILAGEIGYFSACKYEDAASALEKGLRVNERDVEGMTPLMHAVAHFDPRLVELLIEKGADIHAIDKRGLGVIHHAAKDALSAEIIQHLVKVKVDVNQNGPRRETPLMSAAAFNLRNAAKIIKALADSGADINATRAGGTTALMLAAESNGPEAVQALIDEGANIHAVDSNGKTAMDRARENENTRALAPLVIALRNPNRKTVK